MSKLGHHNFFRRPSVTDAVVRRVLLERTDERLESELGDLPMTREQAFERGTIGGDWVARGRWKAPQRVLPAMPLDCLRSFEDGLAVYGEELAAYHDAWELDHSAYLEKLWEREWDSTPMGLLCQHQWELEDLREQQMDAMWREHSEPPDAPLWASRVSSPADKLRGTW
jgi:hypothetical protein